VHALFFSMHLLPLSVRALLACVYGSGIGPCLDVLQKKIAMKFC
jgi:hypothetical protein